MLWKQILNLHNIFLGTVKNKIKVGTSASYIVLAFGSVPIKNWHCFAHLILGVPLVRNLKSKICICLLFIINTHSFAQSLPVKKESKWKQFFQRTKSKPIQNLTNSYILNFPFNSANYKLTFSDEFNNLNMQKWQYGHPWGSIHPDLPQSYWSDSPICVKNGKLYLSNIFLPKWHNLTDTSLISNYTVGCLNSSQSFNTTYGYFAIRSKNPSGPATWPAFWLTGSRNWPPEIDIFEMYGKENGSEVHTQEISFHFGNTQNKTKDQIMFPHRLPPTTDSIFHIYACLWEPTGAKFFTDGVLIWEYVFTETTKNWFQQNMYIIVNNAIDFRYEQYLQPSILPQNFIVDWIRVYQKIE